MIIFYDKKTGEIIGTIDGRVHPKESEGWNMDDGKKRDVGKIIIGWQESGETETVEVQVGPQRRREKRPKLIEHNLNHFEILQDIENDLTPTKIYDFKVSHKEQKLIIIKEKENATLPSKREHKN